jgi:hypothetical protein
MRCRPLPGCQPEGDRCAAGASCCSGNCMIDPAMGNAHCGPGKGMCRPLGDRCMKSDECCDKSAGSCRADETGTLRCLGQPLSESSCIGVGYACAVSERCCSGRCLPDARGALACRPACAKIGAPCAADEDCCGGSCVISDGRASCVTTGIVDPGAECTPPGGPCEPIDGSCCAGTECALLLDGTHACAPISGP